jgi:hypothetical protein
VAVGAPVDEADLGVEALHSRVRQTEADGGGDAVAVPAQPLGEALEGPDSARRGDDSPDFEVTLGEVWVDVAEQIAEAFFEVPGTP